MNTMKHFHKTQFGKTMLSQAKFFKDYARSKGAGHYESWTDAVARVVTMHQQKYAHIMAVEPQAAAYLSEAHEAYSDQLVLGAQRALQFGGQQLLKHEAKMYNCAGAHAAWPKFFQEAMYLLLCGCGVGFSVQKRHVGKLPNIHSRSVKKVKVFQVPDSIEGWADAFGVLLSSYFVENCPFPEYRGYQVHFDLTKIRPKGAMISGGFKAPGPEGLRSALDKCEALLEKNLAEGYVRMRPIVVYDFVMHMADAVLSGGVRRSATLCMFDKDDKEMLQAKTGTWYIDNPQRGRSNNSVLIKRDELNREEWAEIMTAVKDYGEPGFIFTDDLDFVFNPCVEIGMLPFCFDTNEHGFQFCNLVEINGGQCDTKAKFVKACRAAAILATFQAGYTNFKYLGGATRRITERESLIGTSITGWMNQPSVLFDEDTLREGAEIVKAVNKEVSTLLGIRAAARTTCGKPSGNASVLLGTASGIHGEHAPYYIRNVQMNADDDVAKLISTINPKMVEKSVHNERDVIVSFPVITNEGAIYKKDLLGVAQLEYVRKAQAYWVNKGTNVDLCVDTRLRHNISNTITVDNWDAVEDYLYVNRAYFAGVSLLAAAGDKAYAQAPFTEVHTAEEILSMYGEASMFASGLIVDGHHAFHDNLWLACAKAMSFGIMMPSSFNSAVDFDAVEAIQVLQSIPAVLQRDWVRRFHKFALNFFNGDLEKTSFCLKDCYNLHKWVSIQKSIQNIDFAAQLGPKSYVDVGTLGAQGCAGGACEVVF